ncbi:MAG: response regulator [Acidobacteria bacterium]|nr:response regulator [Acidobacteriota bacterium]
MKYTEAVEHHLPYLRRYARAVLGSAAQGDTSVEAALEDLLAKAQGDITRIGLFQALDGALAARKPAQANAASPARRALLLTAMEGFNAPDAAAVLSVTEAGFADLVAEAERQIAALPKSRISIIEDEPLIGASLTQIATELGHTVTGVSATRVTAVERALAERPDLILADIELADGSQGTDAVAEIRKAFTVPVIFVTAFPQRMLAGKSGEPTFLIPKPFKPAHVRAVITQALYFKVSGGR